jgi:hypothetical protein
MKRLKALKRYRVEARKREMGLHGLHELPEVRQRHS